MLLITALNVAQWPSKQQRAGVAACPRGSTAGDQPLFHWFMLQLKVIRFHFAALNGAHTDCGGHCCASGAEMPELIMGWASE